MKITQEGLSIIIIIMSSEEKDAIGVLDSSSHNEEHGKPEMDADELRLAQMGLQIGIVRMFT